METRFSCLEPDGLRDWCISSFKGSNFLPLSAWMHSLMNEVSLPPREPITSAVIESLATVGGACGAAANRVPGFYSGFSSCFSFTKKERRKVRDREKKTPPFIKKILSWHEESWHVFLFFSSDELQELDFVYLNTRPWASEKLIKQSSGGEKWQTTAGTLYISSKKVMQFGLRLCIFAFLRFLKPAPHRSHGI